MYKPSTCTFLICPTTSSVWYSQDFIRKCGISWSNLFTVFSHVCSGRRKIEWYLGILCLSLLLLLIGTLQFSPLIIVACIWVAWLTASLPSNPFLILSLLCFSLYHRKLWFPACWKGLADGRSAGKLESDRRREARVFLGHSLLPEASPAAAASCPWLHLW